MDVKQVGVARVRAHPPHLAQLEAGEALLPDKHDGVHGGEANQGHCIYHQNQDQVIVLAHSLADITWPLVYVIL